ncbi:hypothetical protein CJ030_MR2G019447 [Morella rubra]|uniref:Uncharacterized protein n=1 Tax=Morella rubra TaxID=262757 RepID=A0A6A1WGZ4_9ROSI|nr:hypothetical protein CJ030_MR2G019447 [Morella rubra]
MALSLSLSSLLCFSALWFYLSLSIKISFGFEFWRNLPVDLARVLRALCLRGLQISPWHHTRLTKDMESSLLMATFLSLKTVGIQKNIFRLFWHWLKRELRRERYVVLSWSG